MTLVLHAFCVDALAQPKSVPIPTAAQLASRYGDLAIVWYDGGGHGPELGGPDILPIVERYQKNIVFYHNSQRADIRWGGSETGTVPYPCWGTYPYPYSHSKNQDVVFANGNRLLKTGDPGGRYYMPAMSDAPLRGFNGRHEWFWEPDDEASIMPLDRLVDMYYNSVGHNSTLILGVTPDSTGLLPAADVSRMTDFGNEIRRRFGHSLASTSGTGKRFQLAFGEDRPVSAVVISEDIAKGERVRSYRLEGKVGGRWILVSRGSCIGHKKIDVLPEGTRVSALRLMVDGSVGEPSIRKFSAYVY